MHKIKLTETRAIRPSGCIRMRKTQAVYVELDENEREHTKTGKRDRDEETTGNEVIKCPHDPNPVV